MARRKEKSENSGLKKLVILLAILVVIFPAAAFGYVDDISEPAATYEKIVRALDLLASKRVSKMNKKHTNIPL